MQGEKRKKEKMKINKYQKQQRRKQQAGNEEKNKTKLKQNTSVRYISQFLDLTLFF